MFSGEIKTVPFYLILCFIQGMLFDSGRILCMAGLGSSHLVLGTQGGELWLCDADNRVANVLFASLSDAVVCVSVVKR